MRSCTGCGVSFPSTAFASRGEGRTYSRCRPCQRSKNREYQRRTRDRRRAERGLPASRRAPSPVELADFLSTDAGWWRLDSLAMEFGVSVRSIERAIRPLREAGEVRERRRPAGGVDTNPTLEFACDPWWVNVDGTEW